MLEVHRVRNLDRICLAQTGSGSHEAQSTVPVNWTTLWRLIQVLIGPTCTLALALPDILKVG
jgi:hypothetical protein